MKKIVRLTENQLHRLIEQALNELDIRTRANAANKAASDLRYYNDIVDDKSNSVIKRNYARQMKDKRKRQYDAFKGSVENDVLYKNTFVPYGSDQNRGTLSVQKLLAYDKKGEHPYHLDRDNAIDKMAEYLKGNSYYDKEKGKWLNPDDEGYDAEKSEPWADIRQRKNPNESFARRVTESIIRKLRRLN